MDDANNPLAMQIMHPVLTDKDQTKRERDLQNERFLAFGTSCVTNCCLLCVMCYVLCGACYVQYIFCHFQSPPRDVALNGPRNYSECLSEERDKRTGN